MELVVLTLNIRNTNDRYAERRPLLCAEFGALAPDIVGLQEVVFGDESQDEMLAGSVPHRTYRAVDARSERYPSFGNSILCAVGELQAHETLRLSHNRVVQRALIALPGNVMLWFANTHLHHKPEDPGVRNAQALAIAEWLESAPAADATIVTGDFNTPPFEPAYGAMVNAGFRSAFLEANGEEPAVTWPSGIECDTKDTEGDPNCLDYVWMRGDVGCLAARLVFNHHPTEDATLYPSDHFGILATLTL